MGKPSAACQECSVDHRTPIERRRDDLLEAHGTDPAAYSAEVLAAIANGPIFDAVTQYCPAGRLSRAEAAAREAAQVLRD